MGKIEEVCKGSYYVRPQGEAQDIESNTGDNYIKPEFFESSNT